MSNVGSNRTAPEWGFPGAHAIPPIDQRIQKLDDEVNQDRLALLKQQEQNQKAQKGIENELKAIDNSKVKGADLQRIRANLCHRLDQLQIDSEKIGKALNDIAGAKSALDSAEINDGSPFSKDAVDKGLSDAASRLEAAAGDLGVHVYHGGMVPPDYLRKMGQGPLGELGRKFDSQAEEDKGIQWNFDGHKGPRPMPE